MTIYRGNETPVRIDQATFEAGSGLLPFEGPWAVRVTDGLGEDIPGATWPVNVPRVEGSPDDAPVFFVVLPILEIPLTMPQGIFTLTAGDQVVRRVVVFFEWRES